MSETPNASPKTTRPRRAESRPVSPYSTGISSGGPSVPKRPTTNLQSSTLKTASTTNPAPISTPTFAGVEAAPRRDSVATNTSLSSQASQASSPTRGRPRFTMPHPRDLTPEARLSSLAHRNDAEHERVAELTATFRVSIPKRRGSDQSAPSASSSQQPLQESASREAEEEIIKKRKELGQKLASALEKGDVVLAPKSSMDEKKLREVRLDSAVNLGSTTEVPLRLSTSRSKSGTESGEIAMQFPTAKGPQPAPEGGSASETGGAKYGKLTWESRESGHAKTDSSGVESLEMGRASGGPSYQPSHNLGRKNSSLAIATAKAAGVKHFVVAPPPGIRGFGTAKLGSQTDGMDDGRLSHAALMRLPPAATATKSQALLSEGPLPRRRKSSVKSLGNERERSRSRERKGETSQTSIQNAEQDEEVETDEWDEESLLQLTDWWRQVLAAGATPSPKEMAMMNSFLGEFIKEEMPKIDMVLRTRLHRLLVAIIDGAEIRGEGEEEERFHELARKASLLERRWMKATRGRLFGMERERRDIMFGRSGRLNGVKPWSRGDEKETRWVTERIERAGMAEVEPGAWWLNTTCAYRDGVIGNTSGYVSNFKQHAHPTLVLEVGEEFPTSNLSVTRYINEGSIYYMLLPLMSTLDKPIRVLRNWTLKSKIAPPAGLRFDGWYDILSYSHKRVSMEEDVFRVEVLLCRQAGQVPMARILMVPSPSMLDEWEEYLAIRDDEMRREKSVAEYEEWHRREREGELERELWLCERAEEEAKAVEGGGAEVVEAWGYPST